MGKISACVIVKDEEKNLPRWLDSVKRIAEEIVVVDTGSSDGTVAIAEAAGAKVYHFPWIDDFAAAKNFALAQASGDWVNTGYEAGIIRGKMERNLALLLGRRAEGDASYIADCYYGLEDFEKTAMYAREAVNSGVRLVGRESRPHALLIQALIALGRPLAEIRDAVAAAQKEYPTVGDFSVLGGLGAERAGAYWLAEEYFRQGVDCYAQSEADQERLRIPDDKENLWPLALSRLGTLAKRRGRSEEALEYFAAALSRAPYRDALLIEVGRLLQDVPAADAIAFFHTIYDKEKDAAYLARVLSEIPRAAAALYYDRQTGGGGADGGGSLPLGGALRGLHSGDLGGGGERLSAGDVDGRKIRLDRWARGLGRAPPCQLSPRRGGEGGDGTGKTGGGGAFATGAGTGRRSGGGAARVRCDRRARRGACENIGLRDRQK